MYIKYKESCSTWRFRKKSRGCWEELQTVSKHAEWRKMLQRVVKRNWRSHLPLCWWWSPRIIKQDLQKALGNFWRWFEERATRLLNPRNKRMRKNQDGNRTQNGETWRTDCWTYALWMDPYVSWERTTPNQDVSDPDIQSWLWRALLARFMCLD